MDTQDIKNEYIFQIRNLYKDAPELLKNLDKIENCNFKLENSLGDTAYYDSLFNFIAYGPLTDKCTLFHELDHIRKGNIPSKGQIKAINSYIKIINTSEGIFFDEAITEFIAKLLYKNSKFCDKTTGQSELTDRAFYLSQLEILNKLAQILSIDEITLCKLIEKRYNFQDKSIDKC